MIEYIEDKIFRYCDERKEKNLSINMHKIYQKFIKDWWHIVAVSYGKWIKKTSKLQTKELSEQEW
tara:strand:+ start:280 stop:474 length:195 start_codon:yes stop_codon:yes gene_type:complete